MTSDNAWRDATTIRRRNPRSGGRGRPAPGLPAGWDIAGARTPASGPATRLAEQLGHEVRDRGSVVVADDSVGDGSVPFDDVSGNGHHAAFRGDPTWSTGQLDGGLDFDKLLNNYEWAFEQVPRYRQRIVKIPVLDHPVWVDDPATDVAWHVRRTALPAPGGQR